MRRQHRAQTLFRGRTSRVLAAALLAVGSWPLATIAGDRSPLQPQVAHASATASFVYAAPIAPGSGEFRIYGLDLAGVESEIVECPCYLDHPVISPDGTRIAYHNEGPGGPFIASSDGLHSILVPSGLDYARPIGWLSDGRLVLRGFDGANSFKWIVAVVDPDDPARIEYYGPDSELDDIGGVWAGGDHILWVEADQTGSVLVSLDASTGNRATILQTDGFFEADVSPDGSLFVKMRGGLIEVRSTSTGALVRTLTLGPSDHLYQLLRPQFVGDGRLIVALGSDSLDTGETLAEGFFSFDYTTSDPQAPGFVGAFPQWAWFNEHPSFLPAERYGAWTYDLGVLVVSDDADGDEIADTDDNCRTTFNPGQQDADVDGVGDACDNCPLVWNQDQVDNDLDGLGNVCDTTPDGESPPPPPDDEEECAEVDATASADPRIDVDLLHFDTSFVYCYDGSSVRLWSDPPRTDGRITETLLSAMQIFLAVFGAGFQYAGETDTDVSTSGSGIVVSAEAKFEFCGNLLEPFANALPGLSKIWRVVPNTTKVRILTQFWRAQLSVLDRLMGPAEREFFTTTLNTWFNTVVLELVAFENLPSSFTRCTDTWTPRLEFDISPAGTVSPTIKEGEGTAAIWSVNWTKFTVTALPRN